MTPEELSAEDHAKYRRCVASMQALYDSLAGRDRHIATLAICKVAENVQRGSRIKAEAKVEPEQILEVQSDGWKKLFTPKRLLEFGIFGVCLSIVMSTIAWMQAVIGALDNSLSMGKSGLIVALAALISLSAWFFLEQKKLKKAG